MKRIILYISLSLFLFFTKDTFAQPDKPVKCGFSVLMEQAKLGKITAAQMQRPSLQYRYLTQDSVFLIHYSLEGGDAIDPTSTNSQGIPDWVYEAEKALHKSYFTLVDSMGFPPPPMDSQSYPDEGDRRDGDPSGGARDIYIHDLSGSIYGITRWEDEVIKTPTSDMARASYTEIDNDYVEANYYTHGVNALRATIAHELFHQFHLAYTLKLEDVWWYEISSSWFEDLVYPAVNDYIQYVSSYFASQSQPLHTSGGYKTAHYGYILNSYNEPTVWSDIWANFVTERAYPAIDHALKDIGYSFAGSYRKFGAWNLLTGSRAINGYGYPDAAEYPEITTSGAITIPDSLPVARSIPARDILYQDLMHTGVGLEHYRLNFNPLDARGGGSIAIPGSTNPVDFFLGKQTLSLTFPKSGMAGVGALVNPVVDTTSISISQEKKIVTFFPNTYVPAEHGNNIQIYTVLNEAGPIRADLFDVTGRRVLKYNFGGQAFDSGPIQLTLPIEGQSTGKLSSGVYFLRLDAGNQTQTGKFVLIR
ncbi:MAG: T9SS type A sorting domain-containing protein [Candidatus Marinimicrobia bacterium]|nr:T9SS type A sorting domain-containing protein [Candidatus Neomarinimicrobiota bacterium]MCF7827730.1 T9SS type A sorting domain-containing protein [Candidatus Neomarinimicrobiota bacterium]MCF7881215.1 T9SS type A sorting domain-containing protein [Candidatus Neomarinimicrobiota bacterium]